ncbi:hypothetical protein INP77_14350 [Methylophilus sp. 13]|uniref:hypothetical protein n=1 Tax=Methylophilus sp. 13 TaxID=2781018 RepID=UPI00188DEC57|nr:hypothetical protein [Methylophilus sp. 13]MBF5040675.1 hypothetical protein [Methylophilus sp. 13]
MERILDFNNREVAILLWMAIFLAFCLTKRNIKDSFSDILKAFKPVSIWGPLIIGAFWISLLILILHRFKFWEWSNLKTTVLWTLTFAFYSMFQAIKIEFDYKYRKQLTVESFGIAAILMFIGSVYTLPLWAEFIIFPIAVALTWMQAISARESNFASANKLISYLLNTLGFSYVSFWGYSMYRNPERLFTLANFEDFLLPVILTVWYLPYLYLWKLVMVYELLFVALQRNIKANTELLRFTKLMTVWKLKWSFKAIDQFKRRIATRTLSDRYEVVKQLDWVKLLAVKDKYITENTPLGWAPRNAMRFLALDDLEIKSYSETFDNDWHGSAFKKLKSETLFSSFNYYIEGKETQVKSLKLVMSIWGCENIPDSEVEFLDVGARLMSFASNALPIKFMDRLSKFEDFEGCYEFIFYKFSIKQWEGPKHTIFDYKLELHITEPVKD